MRNLLTGVFESSLGGYNREYLEKRLSLYTNEARKKIRDLLLSTTYTVSENIGTCIVLVESDLDGNYISTEWVFSNQTEF